MGALYDLSNTVEHAISREDSIYVDVVEPFKVNNVVINRSAKSKYGKDIEFKANLLWFPNIESIGILNYIYEKIADGIGSVDKLKSVADKLAGEFIQSNLGHEGFGTSKEWNMKLHFVNQHFLCLELNVVEDTGNGFSAGIWVFTYYKNLNYKTGDIIKLPDIVEPNTLTKELLYRCFEKYARNSVGENVSLDNLSEELYYPDEFTFDEQAIIFYFSKYSIGPGALGEIVLRIPYSEIENGLRPKFKSMMDNSQSIEVRYQ